MSLAARIQDLATRIATEFKTTKNKISGNNTADLSGLATTAKSNILAAINELVAVDLTKQANLGFTPENAGNKNAANGYAGLDGTGKVAAAQLPSYVDDVLEYANLAAFPATGTAGILYVALDTNLVYRWSGSGYIVISQSLALGITSGTAFRGDYGNTAYTHSQIINGANPHNTTFANIASKPTTIAGFGITDAYTKTEIGDPETIFVDTFNAGL